MLGYTDPKILRRFTSHIFRRTAATLLADAGLNMVELKRAGRWNADSAVEEYIDDSEQVRRQRVDNINRQCNNVNDSTKKVNTRTSSEDTDGSDSDGEPNEKNQRVKEKYVKPSETGSEQPAIVQIVLNMHNGKILKN